MPAGNFESTTRHTLGAITRSKTSGTENPLTFPLQKSGILAGLYVDVQGTITGTPVTPDPLGKAKIIKRFELKVNGITLHSFSGVGYHYGIREFIDNYFDPCVDTDARSAVAAGAFNVSMFVPVAINARDRIGLLPLQTDASEIVAYLELEAFANLAASGITALAATVTVTPEIFTMPAREEDWPDFAYLHGWIEEERALGAAGVHEYRLQHGNAYLQALFLCGVGVTGADTITDLEVTTGNQRIYKFNAALANRMHVRNHGRARLAGQYPVDLLGSSGLGTYGSDRDMLYSQAIADLTANVTVSGAATLRALRREMVQVRRS